MVAPVECRVHYDGIEPLLRISQQPPSAIVDGNSHLRIVEKALYGGIQLNEFEISRIDLYHG